MHLIETKQYKTHTELLIFSRDKDGKKNMRIEKAFQSYFYVDEDAIIPDDYRITKIETGYKDLFNNPVKKIYVQRSKDVFIVKDLFKKHYEADIRIANRYIIDVLGEVDIYKLHMLSIDIETDARNTFPNIEEPDQAIISCAFADNNGLKKTLIYKSPECKESINETEDIKVFKTEKELLEAIVILIKKVDPDIITGWSVHNFDLPYLINRMRMFNIEYNNMSPLNMVFCNPSKREDEKWDVKIVGRIILDGLKSLKHFRRISNQGMAENYSLEFTAQSVLGIGKIKHEEGFHDMWVNNPNKLIEYNLRDADLVIQILEKLEIVEFFNSLRIKTFSQLNQVFHTSTLVDGYLLNTAHNKFVLPSKKKRQTDKFKGAFVFEPIPGLYNNVLALDLRALYPNIIKTFNIGIDTFNPNGNIKLKDGVAFDSGIGLMSQTMRELEKERAFYKKKMWKADKEDKEDERKLNHYKQSAIKTIMNGIYGFLGYPGSRLYKREVAEAVTEWGQLIIKHSQKVLEKQGYKIIYMDTDSLYLISKEKTFFSLLKEGKKLIKLLNDSYINFCKEYGSNDCTLEMEFEKIFKKVLFVSKKNAKEGEGAKKRYAYILLWKDKKKVNNDVHFTGFSQVRSDNPKIARDTQKKVVEMIMANVEKSEIIKLLTHLDSDIRSKKILDEDIAFPKGISRPLASYGKIKEDNIKNTFGNKVCKKIGIPPVIQGAIYSNKFLGTQFSQGNKPRWVYVKNVPKGYPDTHVLTFDKESIPEGFEIDYDIMIDKLFKQQLEAIFLASGFGTIPNINSKQKTLF